MKRTAWVLTLLLSACAWAAGQSKPATACPTLSITGPPGITRPGELITFIADLRNAGSYPIRYNWNITGGAIESGQGTSAVTVRRIAPVGSAPVATVKLDGLPQECTNSASETWCELLTPQAEKLDEFDSSLNSLNDDRLGKLVASVQNNPNSQLYIFVPPIASVKRALAARFDHVIHERVDGPRITFIDASVRSTMVQIWLVPPSATPPSKCEGCEPPVTPAVPTPAPANCPTLEVTGPSGVTARGTIMPFVVLVSEPRLKNLSFAWTLSTGTIAEGQGTRVIKVRAPAANGTKNITATVTVQGLPQGCRNVASDTAEIAFTGGRIVGGVYAFVK